MTLQVASSETTQAPQFTEENCAFLSKQQGIINEFRTALQQGTLTLHAACQPPKSFFGRIWYWLFPPLNLHNPKIIKVGQVFGKCVASMVVLNGKDLQLSVNSLLEERKLRRKEFKAFLPGMNDEAINNVIRYMRASAFLFLMFDSAKKNNPDKIRFYLNKAVEWYHKAGIDENDPSLKNYQKVILEHADTLEQFQNESCPAHTGVLLG